MDSGALLRLDGSHNPKNATSGCFVSEEGRRKPGALVAMEASHKRPKVYGMIVDEPSIKQVRVSAALCPRPHGSHEAARKWL